MNRHGGVGVLLDHVAFVGQKVASAAGDGRLDIAIAEVKLGVAYRHYVGVHRGGQGLRRGLGLLVILLADKLLEDQLGITLEIALGLAGQGLIPLQIGLGLPQRPLIGSGIDDEEQVALFDVLAFLEIDLDQLPGEAGLDVDGGIGLDIADLAESHRHRPRLHFGHQHRHRGRRGRRLFAGTGGREEGKH